MRSTEYPSISSHDVDGNPDISTGDEDGYGPNHTASSAVKRRREMQGSEGNPGTSGHGGGCLARSDGNPGTSGHDEDYASYLTLMASDQSDSSDDEQLNQAILASMESQMWVAHAKSVSLRDQDNYW